MTKRISKISRKTGETDIQIELDGLINEVQCNPENFIKYLKRANANDVDYKKYPKIIIHTRSSFAIYTLPARDILICSN